MPNQALEDLARVHNRARKKVIDWVDQKSAVGQLVTNADAPAWNEYREAIAALLVGVANVGTGEDPEESHDGPSH